MEQCVFKAIHPHPFFLIPQFSQTVKFGMPKNIKNHISKSQAKPKPPFP